MQRYPRLLKTFGVRRKTAMSVRQAYQEAVKSLNEFQGLSKDSAAKRTEEERNVKTIRHLTALGVPLDQLDSLSVIHISGTKGKGSTSAMCESILRHCQLRTGLFTSPHLVEVRERIRINGQPLTKEDFTKYYWECHRKLSNDRDLPKPTYFEYLTLMAFYVFLHEKVEVAVIEVGIGGAHCRTNIIRKPTVCGIATLGLDHMSQLGDTLGQIAWHKAGIMKPGRPAFTVPQKQEATEVLFQRAKEIGVKSLKEVPPLSDYGVKNLSVGLPGEHQLVNASLAVQLCKTWMEEKGKWPTTLQKDQLGERSSLAETFQLHPSFIEGLEKVKWSGRGQTIRQDNVTFYFDAAHNIDSIPVSGRWFKSASLTETQSMATSIPNYKLLLFNITKDRDSQIFLDILSDCNYDFIVFCPNIMTHDQGNSADSSKVTMTKEQLMAPVYKNSQAWMELRERYRESGRTLTEEVKCFECISCALTWIQDQMKQLEKENSSTHPSNEQKSQPANDKNSSVQNSNSVHFQVHVTGSSHLVGDVLAQLGFTADDL